ncbi:MEDS domain-containing protein, partial [Streptomyces minutiscleroticus]|uniref:MEDS domain-containing protein n=1 Tax=Streptomyces minutiscleroticus TaxID=68238 RepID=UPI003333038F
MTDGTAAGPFLHPALFYAGEREYLAGTVPFVREGLAAGEPVAVAVPGANRNTSSPSSCPTATCRSSAGSWPSGAT